MDPNVPLPPGWRAQWDSSAQRYLFIDTNSGYTQWEVPSHPSNPAPSYNATPPSQHHQPLPDQASASSTPAPGVAPSGATHSKRRQYAPGQTQAYYGGADAPIGGGGGGAVGYGGGVDQGGAPAPYPAPGTGVAGGSLGGFMTPGQVPVVGSTFGAQQAQPGGQLFTPGLAGETQPYGADGGYGQPIPGPQSNYPTGPAAGINALSDQMGSLGLAGQRPYQLVTTNLLTSPPEPRELSRPPPEIRLPYNSCISNNPNANSDPSYQRSTLNAVPTTASLLAKSKVPLALVITPYRSVKGGGVKDAEAEGGGEGEEGKEGAAGQGQGQGQVQGGKVGPDDEVPLVTDTVIARCRRCRTYINPYVQFIDGGNRWRCCMCAMSNEVPQLFDWDQARNAPGDRWARAELNHSVVEFVAPSEYMIRPPQPAAYVFLIDVSHSAVQSGMVATATRTILENLDRIPDEDGRTKISIVCYDTSLYFFSIPPGSTDSSMLVVSDIEDIFLPKPSDLLVNLAEAKTCLESLLGRVHDMFKDNGVLGSAMGPALQAAFKLLSPIGGKITTLSSTLPTVGAGALKNREDPKILGTSKESSLLQAASPFYKTFAIDCSRAQISVDMFLFSTAYQDVASLACLPHYTSGQTYYYPAFNAARSEDAIKFAREFGQVIATPIMLEAVMRVRASRGLRMSSFHGNFFVRSTDLLAMPAVPQDQSYVVEVQIEETITTPFVVFQTAVLHTTSFSERRIRIVTTALPTTSSLSEVFASADQIALATYYANKAVEKSITNKLEDARDYVFQQLVQILIAYKNSMTSGGAGASAQLAISDNMKMLPVLILGLLKNVGIRQSAQIPSDIRAYSQALLTSLPSQQLIPYIYPSFYSLHNMPPEAGTVGEHGVILPPPLPLTSERLERHGLFLIEDGQTIFLWVGRDSVPQLIADVFNLPSYDVLRGGKTTLPLLDNPFSQRVNAVIEKIRESRRGVYYPHLYVVKEDGEPPLRLWALSALIQDRADVLPSYQQFLQSLKEKVNGAGGY